MESLIDLRLLRLRLIRHLRGMIEALFDFKKMNRYGWIKIQNEGDK